MTRVWLETRARGWLVLRINFSDWLYSLWRWINITQSVQARRAASRAGKSGKAFVRCIFIRFFPVKFQTIKRADFAVSINKNLRFTWNRLTIYPRLLICSTFSWHQCTVIWQFEQGRGNWVILSPHSPIYWNGELIRNLSKTVRVTCPQKWPRFSLIVELQYYDLHMLNNADRIERREEISLTGWASSGEMSKLNHCFAVHELKENFKVRLPYPARFRAKLKFTLVIEYDCAKI